MNALVGVIFHFIGGFTTNVIWGLYLLFKNKTISDYTKPSAPKLKNLVLTVPFLRNGRE